MSPPTALTNYPLLWPQQQQQHYQLSLATQPEQMLHSRSLIRCDALLISREGYTYSTYMQFRPSLTVLSELQRRIFRLKSPDRANYFYLSIR